MISNKINVFADEFISKNGLDFKMTVDNFKFITEELLTIIIGCIEIDPAITQSSNVVFSQNYTSAYKDTFKGNKRGACFTDVTVFEINNLFPSLLEQALNNGDVKLNYIDFPRLFSTLLILKKKTKNKKIKRFIKKYINSVYGHLINGTILSTTEDSKNIFFNFFNQLVFDFSSILHNVNCDILVIEKGKKYKVAMKDFLDGKNLKYEHITFKHKDGEFYRI